MASTLWLVQTTGVAVGEVEGNGVGVDAAVGLVETPGSEQEARIDVAAATASSPGAVLRISVIRAAARKGAEAPSEGAAPGQEDSRSKSMKFGVVLPGGTATQQLEQAVVAEESGWEGGTKYHGRHYHYECDRTDLTEVGRPVQARIPIWVVGVWPRPKSMQRVLRCDGAVPQIEIAGRDVVARDPLGDATPQRRADARDSRSPQQRTALRLSAGLTGRLRL